MIFIMKKRNDISILRNCIKLFQELKKEAIEDCTKAIELNPTYVRALLRRAKLYESDEKLDEALEDYKKILELDPGNSEAKGACMVKLI